MSGMQWNVGKPLRLAADASSASTDGAAEAIRIAHTHIPVEADRSGAPQLSIGTLTTHIEHADRTLHVTWDFCSESSQKHVRLAGRATKQWLVMASRGHESKSFRVQASGDVGSDHPGSCVQQAPANLGCITT